MMTRRSSSKRGGIELSLTTVAVATITILVALMAIFWAPEAIGGTGKNLVGSVEFLNLKEKCEISSQVCEIKVCEEIDDNCDRDDVILWQELKLFVKECDESQSGNEAEIDDECQSSEFYKIVNSKKIEVEEKTSTKLSVDELESIFEEEVVEVGGLTFTESCEYTTRISSREELSEEYLAKLSEIASQRGTTVEHLLKVISFESAGTFSPCIINPLGGAVGQIQFTRTTATKTLGTTSSDLAKMSQIEQLEFVDKYLDLYDPFEESLANLYASILCPDALNEEGIVASKSGTEGSCDLRENPSLVYDRNSGLDVNNDLRIDLAEASAKVEAVIIS